MQYKKFGKFLDNNPRTKKDLNEIRVEEDIAYMDLYDKNSNVVATVIFDSEDISKVKYTKWKLSGTGYAQYGGKFDGKERHFHRAILQTKEMVDHINHNKLDNRKSNLRICNKSTNQ